MASEGHPVAENAGPLGRLLARVRELIATRDTYSGSVMAMDGFGKPCELRSRNVRRWNLSGAISRAIDDAYEGDVPRLRRTMLEGYSFQKGEAERKLRRVERRATEVYGLLWGVCERASLDAVGRSMSAYDPLSHDEAMRVLDRAEEVVTMLGEGRTPGEPSGESERRLLELVDAAGDAGFRLPDGDAPLLLASYTLCRRRVLRESLPWTLVRV